MKTTVLAALAAALLVRPAAAQPVVVKMATVVPEGSTWHQVLREMAEEWKTISGGKVEVRLYPGSVAGDDADVIRKIRLGTLQAGLLTTAGVSAVDRSVYALQVPMLYRSEAETDYVLQKLAPKIEGALEQKGFVVLGWADGGWVRFFTKTAVRSPDDLKSLKMFTWAGDNEAVEVWKGAGFNPVPLPSTEISTAIQTGLVQAVPTTPAAAVIFQWFNHAKYMTDVKWAMLLGAMMIGKPAWERIPADLRPKLQDAARKATARIQDDIRRSAVRDVEAMTKRGLTVVPVDAGAEALWRKTAETAYPRIRGPIIPADAFDEARRLVEEYRKKAPAAK